MKDVFEDEFKNEKPKLKAKAYQNGEWEEVNFDEIINEFKGFQACNLRKSSFR